MEGIGYAIAKADFPLRGQSHKPEGIKGSRYAPLIMEGERRPDNNNLLSYVEPFFYISRKAM